MTVAGGDDQALLPELGEVPTRRGILQVGDRRARSPDWGTLASMVITVVHHDGCPGVALVRQRLAAAVGRVGLGATVLERLGAEGDATAAGGSPTILLDGRDPFPGSAASIGGACRLYPTPTGMQGAPTVDQLVDVLRASAAARPEREGGMARSPG